MSNPRLQEEGYTRHQNSTARNQPHQGSTGKTEAGIAMKNEHMEVTRGSGNVYRDFGQPNADLLQLKSILAADIIKALDRQDLSVRDAHARTGIAAADFSRIRNADLGRPTVDRLMMIMNRLGHRLEVVVKVRRRSAGGASASVASM